MRKAILALAAVLAAMLCLPNGGRPLERTPASRALTTGRLEGSRPSAGYDRLPLQFVPNEGQADALFDFYVQGRDEAVFFAETGLTFVLGDGGADRWAVKLDFVDASRGTELVGLEKSGAVFSYFKGKPEEWKTGLPGYSKIAYRGLWPGIDLVFSGTVDRMKYEFLVRPGADPSRIRLAYRGVDSVRIASDGRLVVNAGAATLRDDVPVAYQESGGAKAGVEVAYALDPAGPIAADRGDARVIYGFRLGAFDRSRPLVLDPAVLVHCGFIGGSGDDAAHAIALDAGGNAYIVGETSSTDLSLPAAPGPYPNYSGGPSDAFIAKLNPDGTALLSCGYIGGSGRDRATGVTVDTEGYVCVAGTTDSPETTFPVTVGPDLTYNGGDSDGFVAKLNAEGTGLDFCGYVGGAGTDMISGVAPFIAQDFTESRKGLYIVGSTSSTEATFPVAVGPDLTYNGGEYDGFVAVLRSDGSGIQSCGYIGGNGADGISALATETLGFFGVLQTSLCVAGTTSSTEVTFPVSVGPDLTYNGGESDAFVARVKDDCTGLDFCGYIGGAGLDAALALCVRVWLSDGDWPPYGGMEGYVAGYTSSTESTFPVSVGPDLTYNGGDYDGFIARLGDASSSAPLSTLGACGYVGGAGSDKIAGVVWASGVYVAGNTSSTESTFPVAFGSDLTYNGGDSDAFLAKLSADWTGIASCGYLGGDGSDRVEAVTFKDGDVIAVGSTGSRETTFPANGDPDPTYNGGMSDAFVARIHMKAPTLTSLSRTSAVAGDPGFTLTVSGADFLQGAQVRWTGGNLPTTYVSDTELQASVAASDLSTPLGVDVSVENPDRESSGNLPFEVRPGPLTLTSLSPSHVVAGGPGFMLDLAGSGFIAVMISSDGYGRSGQPILWNGTQKGSFYVSYTELQVPISESDIAAGGTISVVVKGSETGQADSNPLVFMVSGFAIAASPASKSVTAGETATYSIQLTPQFGSFDSPVSFHCTGLPDLCGASFSPSSLTPGSAGAATTLSLKTTAPSNAAAAGATGFASPGRLTPIIEGALIVLLTLLGALALKAFYGRFSRRWLAAAAVLFSLLISSCATSDPGRSKAGTPPGTYAITVTATSGTFSVSTATELIVK